MKSFEVPVFFVVEAESEQEAVNLVASLLEGHNFEGEGDGESDPCVGVFVGGSEEVRLFSENSETVELPEEQVIKPEDGL